ncbi:AsmA family protein [Novosphingobium sp. PhB165]|uniref:AsmA family protein n=1 Tax=Novosphingobium sp. PhB165 TaxID=2485105 RepID=UPI0014042C6F|nr:AsmA family protein [Novosphingobium sp. PhB165]
MAGAFPASWLKELAERKLSENFGRPVTIAGMSRDSAFSFTPVLGLNGVAIPQAAWAGPGRLASIDRLRVRIAILPMLIGRGSPELVSADGVMLDLVRDADRRVNWNSGGKQEPGASPTISFAGMESVKAQIRYRDALRKRSVELHVSIDPQHGLVASGPGTIDGNAVAVTVKGPAGAANAPWPFEASIVGAAIDMRAKGTMAGPLRTDDMSLDITARANDLKLLDRVIEAGLFHTQPIGLTASVRHRSDIWTIDGLKGKVGNSPFSARLSVDKSGVRTKLDGEIRFATLDFADLASDASRAANHALERAEGERLVPNTRLNIRKIDKTDGRIAFRIDRIASGGSSPLRSAQGVLTIDNRLLIAKPLTLRLSRGVVGGEIRVDQRQGQSEPTITLALDMRGSSIDALAGGSGEIDATVDGRIRLSGVGNTVREAVGKSDGIIGVSAHDGVLPAKLASLLGFDVGKGLLADKGKQATLRCAIARLEMRHGTGTAAPVLVDTSESQTHGTGTISFPDERISLTLTGAPKSDSVLRLPGSIHAGGTIRNPSVVIPPEVKSVGNVIKALGRAISDKRMPEATDADCTALNARVLSPRVD